MGRPAERLGRSGRNWVKTASSRMKERQNPPEHRLQLRPQGDPEKWPIIKRQDLGLDLLGVGDDLAGGGRNKPGEEPLRLSAAT